MNSVLKSQKLWRINIFKVTTSDTYTKKIKINLKPIYRYGSTKNQVISRLKRTYHLKNYDDYDGQCSISYEFEMEEIIKEKQPTIWDYVDKEN